MSSLTYSGVIFTELVAEILRRWKSEGRCQRNKELVDQDEQLRLRLQFWDYSIGIGDLEFMRQQLEKKVPRETPIELVFSHCTLVDPTVTVDCLKELAAHLNLEALHFVERQITMTYPDVVAIVQATRSLRELTFNFQNQTGSSDILQAPSSQTLRALTVDAARVPMETIYVQELACGLNSLPLLKCINLKGFACNDQSLLFVVQAVLAMESLVELKLEIRDASLTSSSLYTLAMLFSHILEGTLVDLYVWDSKYLFSNANQRQVDAFSIALENCRGSIRIFSLQDVGIQQTNLVRIFQALEHVGGGLNSKNSRAMEVEITGIGFFQNPTTFSLLVASLSRLTGVRRIDIEDENMYEEWDTDQDLKLLAALKHNQCIESMSFWIGTTDRIDLMKTSTRQIFQRNRSLTAVSCLTCPSKAGSLPHACLSNLLEALSRQAGCYAADPVYKVLQHSLCGIF